MVCPLPPDTEMQRGGTLVGLVGLPQPVWKPMGVVGAEFVMLKTAVNKSPVNPTGVGAPSTSSSTVSTVAVDGHAAAPPTF